MPKHTCDALVVSCIDFRFQQYIRKWTDEHLANKTFDVVAFAGATKNLDIVMGQIDLSKQLHDINQVVLIHHEDCGAYGASGSPEVHAQDLKKAKERILATYPSLQVQLYYLHLDGTFESIT